MKEWDLKGHILTLNNLSLKRIKLIFYKNNKRKKIHNIPKLILLLYLKLLSMKWIRIFFQKNEIEHQSEELTFYHQLNHRGDVVHAMQMHLLRHQNLDSKSNHTVKKITSSQQLILYLVHFIQKDVQEAIQYFFQNLSMNFIFLQKDVNHISQQIKDAEKNVKTQN